MASLHEDSSKTMEEIRKDLICQTCEGRPRPGKSQWYRCLNLHLICQDCKAECRKCDCDEWISKAYCTFFEKLLNVKDLKFDCTNTKHGCQQAFLESALEDHESEDDFVDAGKCFAIPRQVFMAQFVNEDRQFEYSLEVKNLKKELKDENYCESGISDNDE